MRKLYRYIAIPLISLPTTPSGHALHPGTAFTDIHAATPAARRSPACSTGWLRFSSPSTSPSRGVLPDGSIFEQREMCMKIQALICSDTAAAFTASCRGFSRGVVNKSENAYHESSLVRVQRTNLGFE